MIVEEVMTHGVDFADRTDSIQEVAQKMASDNVGMMPVFDGNFVVGVVTDRDLVVRAVAKGFDAVNTKVREVMSENVYFCRNVDSLRDAAGVMKEKRIRRLLVKNEYGHVTGVVSLADLARSKESELTAEVMRFITKPAEPEW